MRTADNKRQELPEGSGQLRLRYLIFTSQLTLLWERAAPAFLIPICLAALFIFLAWVGFFEVLPEKLRSGMLAVFLIAGLASLIPLARKPFPARREAVARLDRQFPHRIIASLSDRLGEAVSAEGAELWRLHRERLATFLAAFKPVPPRLDIFQHDPYGLRFLLPLLLLIGAVVAGPERFTKLQNLFVGAKSQLSAPRLDAWITPRAYTGRAPIYLALNTEHARAAPLSVPQGSMFTLRTQRSQGVEFKISGKTIPLVIESGEERLVRFEHKLQGGGPFHIKYYGRVLAEGRIDMEPDLPPQIALEGKIEILRGQSLRLRAHISDDYGVTAAGALFEMDVPMRQFDLRRKGKQLALLPAPDFALALGAGHPRKILTTTTKDISDHPYAGLPMRLTLFAEDDAENMTKMEAGRIVLPARPFTKPIARALIALRQILALDKNERSSVEIALGLLMAEPDKRFETSQQFLQMSAVRAQMVNAYSDADLIKVLQRLWDVAVFIENGDLSDAERALAEAQAKLEAAIENNAGPEEISRLMQDLRKAMAQYLQQLQKQAAQNQPPNSRPPANMQMLTEADLERMMKRIEQLSRAGAKDAAREQLQSLRDLLSALRNSDPSASAAASAMQQKLNEISDMMREQQKLMDETFRERNRQNQQRGTDGGTPSQGEKSQSSPSGSEALNELEKRQGRLREKLNGLRQQVPNAEEGGPNSLGSAEGAMAEAESQLEQNDPHSALPNQGQALEEMRKGAQSLMRAMRGNDGQGQGGTYGYNQGEGADNLDAPAQYNPFSDGSEGNDESRIPDEAERKNIQDILDEVKRRLSDPQRARIERDYLERLLRPF